MEQEGNQLSNLPKIILHHILSRLPEKDAARTSVLSKSWAETWSTFPFLSFYDTKIIEKKRKNFIESEDYLRKRKKFLNYVERTLLRFHDQGLAIKQFKPSVNNLHDLSKDVDLWLKLASESGVEVLELFQSHGDRERFYILPTSVLEAKSLTKLVLNGRIRVNPTFTNLSVKFLSLQVLSLEYVSLGDEQVFNHLISLCPLIEYITLRWCYVLNPGGEGHLHESRICQMKSLSMHDLPKLKGVDIQGIQEVYIDAPCLENLCYRPSGPYEPFKMDFNRCRNLRGLTLMYLSSTIITNKWFLELFAKFPFLESLKLQSCSMSERINISSVQLKVLELSNCFSWKEVNINAPNLLSCVYVGYRRHATIPIISFLGCSSQLVVNVEIIVDYPDLCKLRESIQNIKYQTVLASVSLFIFQPIVDALNPVALQVSSPPPSIKHLVLHCVQGNESLYLPLVYKLLSSCYPATISISLLSFPFSNRAFIEVFYVTLMGRNEDKCFCNSGHTKCWWHGLKGVKVTSSMNTDKNADFKTMLDAMLTTPASPASPKNISFRLEF